MSEAVLVDRADRVIVDDIPDVLAAVLAGYGLHLGLLCTVRAFLQAR